MSMKNEIETLKTDVLIIGAGGAGCKAAIAAAEENVDVLVVAKNPIARGGITTAGFGGFSVNIGQEPGDSLDIHFRDIVEAGRYLADQDLVEVIVREEHKVFDDLIEYGVRIEKKRGKFIQLLTPGQTRPRMTKIIGGGHALVSGLKKTMESKSNIKVVDDMIITKLVVTENKIKGAIGLELKKGKLLIIEAKSIVIATGGAGQLWLITDCPPDSTGDGYALAYHAGAELIDMEQQLFYPTVAVSPDRIYGLEITYEWCLHHTLGGWLINNKGEKFFPPKVLPTRDISARMIFKEIYSGRGIENYGVYFDIAKCQKSRREKLASLQRSNKRLLGLGIDLRKQVIEVAPGAHTTLGGIRINKNAETFTIGLFAAGECSANVHGANRIAGHAYLETQVFGLIAGKNAANFAKKNNWSPIKKSEAKKEYDRLNGFFLVRKHGVQPNEIKNELRKALTKYVGPIRNQDGLETAIEKIKLLKNEELPRLSVTDIKEYNNDWIEAIEISNMLDVAEIVARCALIRRESRGTHFREDYPELDNKNWLKHTIAKIENGELSLGIKPVIMSKVRPTEK
jgi:fumarate reductase (CoM/CoB) subunit A